MRNSKLKSSIRRKVQVFDSDEALAKYIADLSDKFAKESYAFTVVLSGGTCLFLHTGPWI